LCRPDSTDKHFANANNAIGRFVFRQVTKWAAIYTVHFIQTLQPVITGSGADLITTDIAAMQ
jgi:hypothetical protein